MIKFEKLKPGMADPRLDRAKPDGTARLVEFSDG